jgi:hypothetical protein
MKKVLGFDFFVRRFCFVYLFVVSFFIPDFLIFGPKAFVICYETFICNLNGFLIHPDYISFFEIFISCFLPAFIFVYFLKRKIVLFFVLNFAGLIRSFFI